MKMSQTLNKLKQFASKLYKPGESTSSRPGWMVRDSQPTIGGLRMTNTTAGTFTGLILSFAIGIGFAIPTHADSITVSISGNPSITVAPSSTGTFADSGNINISVTNAPASGYTLAITGGGNTSLTGTTDSTKSITSISSAIDQNTFNTNTSYNNKWGYKPSMHYNTSTEQRASNSNYLPSPTSNADIIDITSDNSSNNYTMSIGARVTSDLGFQTYENNTFVITAVGNSHVLDCDPTKLCVEYEGNGLTYDGETLNRVNYNSTTTQKEITKYSHTPNINDEGAASGSGSNYYYKDASETTNTSTINGVNSLNITIYYDAYTTTFGYFTVYQSPFDISSSNDATISNTTGNLSGKLSGNKGGYPQQTPNYTGWNSQTYNVNGDTVKIHIPAVSNAYGYGYYAIITGTSTVHNRSVSSGEYATPTGTNAIFHGWSTTQTTPGGGLPSQVEYANESDILTKMPGNEGEAKTLYAVWQQEQTITFNMDSNTSSIDIIDSNGTTVKSITTSGQTATLAQGSTYTIKPTYASGYSTNTITKTSGAGTISGKSFTVGAGAATISVTSRMLTTFDQAYAAAGKTKYNNYYKIQDMNSTICSNVDSADLGVIGQVIDTRDNEVYYIGKLADNKCWMLDNLNLAGGTALSSADTNVTDDYINSFTTSNNLTKTGNTIVLPASSTSGFKTNNYSYVYNSGNKTTSQSDCTDSQPCNSYYSWDAATLGSGRSISTDNTDAEQSICPKGWKLPSTYNGSGTAAAATDLRALLIGYGGSDSIHTYNSSTNPTGATMYSNIGPGSTPNFLLAGRYGRGSFSDGGSYGLYWSSTSLSYITSARGLYFTSTFVGSIDSDYRYLGLSVRCLFSS